jgi:hypothetical protein
LISEKCTNDIVSLFLFCIFLYKYKSSCRFECCNLEDFLIKHRHQNQFRRTFFPRKTQRACLVLQLLSTLLWGNLNIDIFSLNWRCSFKNHLTCPPGQKPLKAMTKNFEIRYFSIFFRTENFGWLVLNSITCLVFFNHKALVLNYYCEKKKV